MRRVRAQGYRDTLGPFLFLPFFFYHPFSLPLFTHSLTRFLFLGTLLCLFTFPFHLPRPFFRGVQHDELRFDTRPTRPIVLPDCPVIPRIITSAKLAPTRFQLHCGRTTAIHTLLFPSFSCVLSVNYGCIVARKNCRNYRWLFSELQSDIPNREAAGNGLFIGLVLFPGAFARKRGKD